MMLLDLIYFFLADVEYVEHTLHQMGAFGENIRRTREKLYVKDKAYSVRKMAGRIGVEPSYLSKIERGVEAPPSERTIVLIAKELDLDPDKLLARAGKIPSDVKAAVVEEPDLMPKLVRKLRKSSRHELRKLLGQHSGAK